MLVFQSHLREVLLHLVVVGAELIVDSGFLYSFLQIVIKEQCVQDHLWPRGNDSLTCSQWPVFINFYHKTYPRFISNSVSKHFVNLVIYSVPICSQTAGGIHTVF